MTELDLRRDVFLSTRQAAEPLVRRGDDDHDDANDKESDHCRIQIVVEHHSLCDLETRHALGHGARSDQLLKRSRMRQQSKPGNAGKYFDRPW